MVILPKIFAVYKISANFFFILDIAKVLLFFYTAISFALHFVEKLTKFLFIEFMLVCFDDLVLLLSFLL